MTFEFDPAASSIQVKAAYSTGSYIRILNLVLDTGATQTVINPKALSFLGDVSGYMAGAYEVETANGRVTTFGVRLPALFALGQMREDFVVIVHDIGSSLPVDGVLGLDFLRGHRLCLDFVRGELELL
ncbi:hypothetical protein EON83_01175 [bacterium]|nr:MAG: hypothetical protein EON83_01175 [bacterium]